MKVKCQISRTVYLDWFFESREDFYYGFRNYVYIPLIKSGKAEIDINDIFFGSCYLPSHLFIEKEWTRILDEMEVVTGMKVEDREELNEYEIGYLEVEWID